MTMLAEIEYGYFIAGRWGKNWIMLQLRYASAFALYDIVN